MTTVKYDQDIVAWANEQAALLRAGRYELLDIEHIADEIEDVGKSEQRELISRMAVQQLGADHSSAAQPYRTGREENPQPEGRAGRSGLVAGRLGGCAGDRDARGGATRVSRGVSVVL